MQGSARGFLPAWLTYSLLTLVAWGAWGLQSKIAVERVSAEMNQILFPIGLLPLIYLALRSKNLKATPGDGHTGASYGLLTGILGGTGNVAFYYALSRGGSSSIVTPLVGLAPLVTVVLAFFFLGERLNGQQLLGLPLALAAIYLLST